MITFKKSLWIIVPVAVYLSLKFACSIRLPPVPKEGEIVTWWINSNLIIKTKLGERRRHIPKSTDKYYYEPMFERYLGQFPIDFIPEAFPKLTRAEFSALEQAVKGPYKKSPRAGSRTSHLLEFNLMLDGAWVQATDLGIHGGGIDHPAQVKVVVNSFKSFQTNNDTTKDRFEHEFLRNLDPASKVSKYGIDCYLDSNPMDAVYQIKVCLGASLVPGISGFKVVYSPHRENLTVRSIEPIYGGTTLFWITHKKNFSRLQEIDAAIWWLLAVWNVSPN